MASVKKFRKEEVPSLIRHVERSAELLGNKKIDMKRIQDDYILSPLRGIDSYNYFVNRISKMHYMKRKDVIMMIGWVVTCPADLLGDKQFDFFSIVYQFLAEKYGENNIVTAVVHNDEERPHIHVLIIPAVKDNDLTHEEEERILCKAVINRKELAEFHPALQRYLSSHGLNISIQNNALEHKQPKNGRTNDFYFSRG